MNENITVENCTESSSKKAPLWSHSSNGKRIKNNEDINISAANKKELWKCYMKLTTSAYTDTTPHIAKEK